jgi:hypothetical protein
MASASPTMAAKGASTSTVAGWAPPSLGATTGTTSAAFMDLFVMHLCVMDLISAFCDGFL